MKPDRHYLRPFFFILFTAGIFLLADTIAWWTCERDFDARTDALLRTLRQEGWSITPMTRRHGGWPFGAWVDLSSPVATYDDPHRALRWEGDALRLGGSWIALIDGSLPLILKGRQELRLGDEKGLISLSSEDIRLSLFKGRKIRFRTALLQGSTPPYAGNGLFSLRGVSGTAYIAPSAGPQESRASLALDAQTLSVFQPGSAFALSLDAPKLALALAGSAHRGHSLLDRRNYSQLLLRTFSASLPRATGRSAGPGMTVSLSGLMSIPDGNGRLTLRLTHWRETLQDALTSSFSRRYLTVALRETLLNALPSLSDRPQPRRDQALTLSLPVVRGRILPELSGLIPPFRSGGDAPQTERSEQKDGLR